MPIRVLLADDHQIVRQGIKALLKQEGFDVIGEASNGCEAVQLARTLHPDVAVLDLSMPVLNGLSACQEILQASPRTKPILLTMHVEDHYVLQALRAGVRGYVVKQQAATELIQAIWEVANSAIYLSPSISAAVVQAYLHKTKLPADPLTHRERQVLQLVAEGKTTKEIAQHLGISIKTAESHRDHIMKKLDIHETASLVRYAIRLGVIEA